MPQLEPNRLRKVSGSAYGLVTDAVPAFFGWLSENVIGPSTTGKMSAGVDKVVKFARLDKADAKITDFLSKATVDTSVKSKGLEGMFGSVANLATKVVKAPIDTASNWLKGEGTGGKYARPLIAIAALLGVVAGIKNWLNNRKLKRDINAVNAGTEAEMLRAEAAKIEAETRQILASKELNPNAKTGHLDGLLKRQGETLETARTM